MAVNYGAGKVRFPVARAGGLQAAPRRRAAVGRRRGRRRPGDDACSPSRSRARPSRRAWPRSSSGTTSRRPARAHGVAGHGPDPSQARRRPAVRSPWRALALVAVLAGCACAARGPAPGTGSRLRSPAPRPPPRARPGRPPRPRPPPTPTPRAAGVVPVRRRAAVRHPGRAASTTPHPHGPTLRPGRDPPARHRAGASGSAPWWSTRAARARRGSTWCATASGGPNGFAQRFDIVSWDPRGVGQSQRPGLRRGTPPPSSTWIPTPPTPPGWPPSTRPPQALATDCAGHGGPLLDHLDTRHHGPRPRAAAPGAWASPR